MRKLMLTLESACVYVLTAGTTG